MTTEPDLDDTQLAAELATRAGELLLDLRERELGRGPLPADAARELSRRGDREANALLLRMLTDHRPGDALLSEESADSDDRLAATRVWIIDPLDGSREYALPGRTDWAVHIALWERGHGITAAAVAQPALGRIHRSDTCTAVLTDRDRPRILVSDSRPPEFATALADRIRGELAPMGSAGAKAMAVLRGEADAYVHAGGQWEWDSAAPVGVALAAGLHCSRIDGTPLTYNEAHPYLPDLLICRPDLSQLLLSGIAELTETTHVNPRIAMVREYLDSLLTHDASKVRLAADCHRVENGKDTGRTGPDIVHDLETGAQYLPLTAIRNLTFTEFGTDVVARYQLDMSVGDETHTVSLTEHFAVPGAEITAVTAIIEPAPHPE